MTPNPYAAFGHTVFVCKATAGEFGYTPLNESGKYSVGIIFFTKGSASLKVVETGENIGTRTAGWLSTENILRGAESSGVLRADFTEDTEWVCIANSANPNGLPTVQKILLKDGDVLALTVGTNLFLASGEVTLNGKSFVGPTQIRVRSADVIAYAKGDVYALKFV